VAVLKLRQLKLTSRQSAAWIAALICATMLAGVPAVAGLSSVSQESTSAGVAAQVTPVILDPSSGRQIAVWSVSDGISNKIAYARLENGIFTDFHYLTFGRGHHTEPRVAVTRDGAFLFWIADGKRYLYAPIDLANGRLHASPRRVPLEKSGIQLTSIGGAGRSTGTEGGSDVPVVTEECPPNEPDCALLTSPDGNTRRRLKMNESGGYAGNTSGTDGGSDVPVVTERCPPGHDDCNVLSSGGNQRRQILTEGGSDVPVVVELESLWSVSSRPTCNLMILSIPSAEAGAYHLLKFRSGRINKTGRIRLVAGGGGLPSATTESILDSSCF